MVVLVALLLVLAVLRLSFTTHVLWVIAVASFVLWPIGVAIGRGEPAGRHPFYRW
ncbi:MAG TPA: hypothetical protein VMB82_07285 [Acidimicrobiales bacterium]|nr:hypothetical protein [Acidimicrobiales bacterium]